MLGGDIVVTSEIGAGSTFALRLPATAPIRVSNSAFVTSPRPSVRAPAIVVTADPHVAEGLFTVLTGLGVPVLPVASGPEALRLTVHIQPALILVDDSLGETELLATLAALHGDPERASIPRFVVGELPPAALARGTVPLPRPLRRESVLAALARHLAPPPALGELALVLGDAARRDLPRRHFEARGWQVHEAADVEAAAGLPWAGVAAVVLDLELPGVAALAGQLRDQARSGRPLVVLGLGDAAGPAAEVCTAVLPAGRRVAGAVHEMLVLECAGCPTRGVR
jgi:CheY-like chemotaxis protein